MKNRTMINTMLTVVMIASMLACATQKNDTTATADAADKETSTEVTLTITMTSNYCGGAAPSEDMVANLKKPKPFSNKKLYVSTKKALQENMMEMTSSASGSISAPLEAGTYYVFLPEKVSAKLSGKDRSEKECNKWKNTPNGTFTVGSDKNISFNIHKTCDGCGALRM